METDGRCAYSLQPVNDLGRKSMEVDHFDPTLKHPFKNRHGNLVPASRHCNGAKSDTWHTEEDRQLGLYIINPYYEKDYGRHLSEDRNTGELIGKTVTGRWHIDVLDLNADHLVTKRLDRTKIHDTLLSAALASGADPTNAAFLRLLQMLSGLQKTLMLKMIPILPFA